MTFVKWWMRNFWNEQDRFFKLCILIGWLHLVGSCLRVLGKDFRRLYRVHFQGFVCFFSSFGIAPKEAKTSRPNFNPSGKIWRAARAVWECGGTDGFLAKPPLGSWCAGQPC